MGFVQRVQTFQVRAGGEPFEPYERTEPRERDLLNRLHLEPPEQTR